MTLVMLLSKKKGIVREIEKELKREREREENNFGVFSFETREK